MTVLYAFLILAGIGLLLGVGLSIASFIFYVKPDTRVEDIKAMLPNYNCGACGYPGCEGMATAIVNGEVTDLTKCKPGKPDVNYCKIKEYLESHPNEDGTVVQVKY